MTVTWWTDEETARGVLDTVDDQDPGVGAGVVVLGLHGLGAAALRRAAPTLALDPGTVVAALDQVDLGPVSQAWRRVGGADDDVALMKSDADVGAFRTISMLRQMGMAPQQAVERAASLYGLPAKSAVSVVAKFQDETGPAADAAALGEIMHFASGVGDDLVAKAYETRGYHGDDPDERDANGRFRRMAYARRKAAAPKAAAPQQQAPAEQAPKRKGLVDQVRKPDADAEQARKARMKRVQLRASAAQQAKEAEAAPEQRAERTARRPRKVRSTRTERVVRPKVGGGEVLEWDDGFTDPPETNGAPPSGTVLVSGPAPVYMMLPKRVVMGAIERKAEVYAGSIDNVLHYRPVDHHEEWLESVMPSPTVAMSMPSLRAQLKSMDASPHYKVDFNVTADSDVSSWGLTLSRADGSSSVDVMIVAVPDAPVQTASGTMHPQTSMSLATDRYETVPLSLGTGSYDLTVTRAVVLNDVPTSQTITAREMDDAIEKAYETRGYHGDDPDERDASGRFKRLAYSSRRPVAPRPAPQAQAPSAQQQAPGPTAAPPRKQLVSDIRPGTDSAARATRMRRVQRVTTAQAQQAQAERAQAEQREPAKPRMRRLRRERVRRTERLRRADRTKTLPPKAVEDVFVPNSAVAVVPRTAQGNMIGKVLDRIVNYAYRNGIQDENAYVIDGVTRSDADGDPDLRTMFADGTMERLGDMPVTISDSLNKVPRDMSTATKTYAGLSSLIQVASAGMGGKVAVNSVDLGGGTTGMYVTFVDTDTRKTMEMVNQLNDLGVETEVELISYNVGGREVDVSEDFTVPNLATAHANRATKVTGRIDIDPESQEPLVVVVDNTMTERSVDGGTGFVRRAPVLKAKRWSALTDPDVQIRVYKGLSTVRQLAELLGADASYEISQDSPQNIPVSVIELVSEQ